MTRNSEPWTSDRVWAAASAERIALADDLDQLTDDQWQQPTLCGRWSVRDVVPHLTVAATIAPLRWLRSVIAAGFDFDRHNDARLAEHIGGTPAETLARFRAVINSRSSRFGPPAMAWLGEVIIHSHDIRRPLGIDTTPPIETVTQLARFLAHTDVTVPSKKMIKGLRVRATDGPFETGSGPLVVGPTLSHVMVMAGRNTFCNDLTGTGVDILRARSR